MTGKKPRPERRTRQQVLRALGLKSDPGGLTQEVLDAAATRALPWRAIVSDSAGRGHTPGLFILVQAGRPGPKGKLAPGPSSFYVQRRVGSGGTVRQVKLGGCDVMPLAAARTAAKKVLLELVQGIDPNQQKQEERTAEAARVTLKKYIESDDEATGYSTHLDEMKAGASELSRLLTAWKPLLGKQLDSITEADINRTLRARRNDGISDGAVLRDWSSLQTLLRYAYRKRVIASLPFRGRPEALHGALHGERDRYLGQRGLEEVKIFHKVLAEESTEVQVAVKLLLATGARREEILDLRREQVSKKEKLARIPKEKTKSGRKLGDRRIYLSDEALALLKSLDGDIVRLDGFYFSRPRATQESRLKRFMHRVEAAGIKDLRLHDLRRSFATAAFKAGARLAAVSKLLGHGRIATTERYTRLVEDELHAAVGLVRL